MQGNADHYPVKIMLSAKIERENTRKFFRDISFTKNPGFVLEYKKPLLQHIQANEDLIYQNNCPCSAFSEFSRLFREVTDSFAPMRNAKKKSKMPLWFNKRLKNLRSKRDEAHSKWKREKENTNLLEQFRNRRQLLEQEIKMAKRSFYLNKFNSGLGKSRKTFKLLNELKGKSSNSTNIPLLSSSFNNKIEPTDEDNANLFNKFFATIRYNINKHLKKPFTPNFLSEETSVFFYQTTKMEVIGIVAQLDNKFSSGDDLIINVLIKTSMEVVIQYLVFLNFLFRGEFSQKNWQKQKFSRYIKEIAN